MRLAFNSLHNPKPFTLVLARKDGTKLGTLPAHHLKTHGEFNSSWTMEFSIYKVNNNRTLRIWDEIQDFRLLWLKELDLWFEINVQLSDGNVCIKNVTATSLAEAELSQTHIYKMEINTETDIERDDYKPTVFYDSTDISCSLLNRLLSKTPHYRVVSVPENLMTLQRSFSFDGSSIYDSLQDVSKEIECYIDFSIHSDENGKPDRAIRVYDLKGYCLECHSRGEFDKVCSECGSSNVSPPYGNDIGIFVTKHNLTDEIAFETNKDSIKNCFKLEAGDELMTATAISCNPNGSSYLWYIPQFMKDDMPQKLVDKINSYDELNLYYQDEHIVSPTENLKTTYNELIEKYLSYKTDLVKLDNEIIGFPSLIENYYHTIDFNLLLKSSLMPSIETVGTNAAEQAAKLTTARLSPVAIYSVDYASGTTVESAVLSMAKAQIDYRYQVRVLSGSYTNSVWTGSFTITNYYNEEDTAISEVVSIEIIDNYESYVQQMLDKSLSNTTNTATDIVTMFGMSDADFQNELKKYSLNRLQAFNDSCEACINILIEQGCGNDTAWAESDQDLYVDLYVPYQNKLGYIQSEIKLRESEIAIIESVQDEIINNRNEIQNALNFETYLGTDLWHTFIAYRREDTYSNNNYISDGLDNTQLFTRARQFIDIAKSDLYKSANLQHSISSTLKNFLVMKGFEKLLDNFELGNFIYIECDEKVYRIRLLAFDIDFDNLNDLSVVFSDVRDLKNNFTDIKDVLDNSKSMGTTYDNVKNQASKGKDSKDQLDDWTAHGLSLTQLNILNNVENQDYIFDEHGMLFRKYNPLLESYEDEQLKIINSTIAITNDNWKTVKTAIGKHYYVNPITKETTYGYGINGEVLIGKIILGEQLGIYNLEATLQFNKNGLSITNGSYTFRVNPNDDTNLVQISSSSESLFTFSKSGNLYIKGKVIATEGDIGGCSIVNGKLTIDSAHITSGTIDTARIPTLTADKIDATNLKVEAANITGTLTADRINGEGLSISNANIGNMTIADKLYFGGNSTYYINANYNNNSFYINLPGFRVDDTEAIFSGKLSAATGTFSGTLSAATGSFSGSITSSSAIITGGKISLGSTGGTEYVSIDSGGIFIGDKGIGYVDINWSNIDVAINPWLSDAPSAIVTIGGHGGYDTGVSQIGIRAKLDPYSNNVFDISGENINDYLHGVGASLTLVIGKNYNDGYGQLLGTWQGSFASSSDRNLKHDIELLSEKYSIFFDSLISRRFKLNDGTSDRYHTGFIAQEVEEAIVNAGLTTQEAALFVRFSTYNNKTKEDAITYALRYDEFVSLNTWQIQLLKPRVTTLEEKIETLEQENKELKNQLSKILNQ